MMPFNRNLPLFFVGLFVLLGFVFPPVALAAAAQHETRYSEASYCYQVAKNFKDSDLEKRWRSVKGKYLPLLDEKLQSRISNDAKKKVETESQKLPAAAFRNQYEQCKTSLSEAEKTAQSAHAQWAQGYSKQLDQKKEPYRNPYAPPKYTTLDLAGDMAGSRDLAEHETFKNKARAWDAYCLVASESLYTFISQNSAAFGLDPNRAEDAHTLKLLESQRSRFREQLLKDFNSDRQAAQVYANTQQENYRKGFEQHKTSDDDLVNFAKVQMSDCDSNFDLWWKSSPVAATSKNSPPVNSPSTKYSDPFSLLKRAQYCYSIDINAEPFPKEYITPEQKKWQAVFLAAQWWSALQGYDLFATGHTGLELSSFARDDYMEYGSAEYDACVAEIDGVMSTLPALMKNIYDRDAKSAFKKNMNEISQTQTYFSKPRTNEDLWCYAVMDQLVEALSKNPKSFEALKALSDGKDIKVFFEARKDFWAGVTEKEKYNYERFVRDVKLVLKDLRNPGIGTSDELNAQAEHVFFLGVNNRCAMRERFIRGQK